MKVKRMFYEKRYALALNENCSPFNKLFFFSFSFFLLSNLDRNCFIMQFISFNCTTESGGSSKARHASHALHEAEKDFDFKIINFMFILRLICIQLGNFFMLFLQFQIALFSSF